MRSMATEKESGKSLQTYLWDKGTMDGVQPKIPTSLSFSKIIPTL